MRLDLSSLPVPAEVPVVPVGENHEREPGSTPQTLVNQGFHKPVPVVPAVPVHFEKVHAKPGKTTAASASQESGDWWASYTAMANETVQQRALAGTTRKAPQDQTIDEWRAEYEYHQRRYDSGEDIL